MKLNNVTLKKRFVSVVVVYVMIILVEGVLIFIGGQQSNEQVNRITDRMIPILNKAHELKLSVVQVQQWLTDISATRGQDGLNDGFDEAAKHAKLFKSYINEISLLDPVNKDTYNALIPVFDTYYSVGKKMAHAYVENGPAGGNKVMAEFDAAAAELSKKINVFVDNTKNMSSEHLQQHVDYIKQQNIKLLLGFSVLLGMIIFLYLTMNKALSYFPLVVAEVDKIANGDVSGEMNAALSTTKGDEVGKICLAVKEMKLKLRELISQVADGASQLASASSQIAGMTGTALMSVQEQKSETEQVATAMNEMTATVSEVAKNTSNAAHSAQLAQESTHSGRTIIEETIEVINNLAADVVRISEVIHAVESDSEQIGSVLDVIKGIAEQTNLLALNAAIEAARAGEQGRGFAVVADEVRTLASRTQESTQEIQAMIEKLQTSSRSAVEAMLQGRQQAENGVQKVMGAGDALQEIISAVNAITDLNTQIASAAEEQTAVAEEVDRNITNISHLSEQAATTSEQVATSCSELEHLTGGLQQLVKQFKI